MRRGDVDEGRLALFGESGGVGLVGRFLEHIGSLGQGRGLCSRRALCIGDSLMSLLLLLHASEHSRCRERSILLRIPDLVEDIEVSGWLKGALRAEEKPS